MQRAAQGPEADKNAAVMKQVFSAGERPSKIDGLHFTVQSPAEMLEGAVLQVYANTLYKMPQRTPTADGVLDPRLGVSSTRAVCTTCHQSLRDCSGHFGAVKLPVPVFHPGYFTQTLKILQAICKACSRILLPDATRAMYLRSITGRRKERGSSKAMIKAILVDCKKLKRCPFCDAPNGTVKKIAGTFKLLHDPYNKQDANRESFMTDLSFTRERNSEVQKFADKAVDDLNPARVLRLFQKILALDMPLLDIACRPEHLLITCIAVPPVCIRPSVEMDSGAGSNEDDATARLLAVCDMSISIRKNLDMGIASWETIMEQWDFLQVQCVKYINSEARLNLDLQKHDKKTHSRGFVQRLKGKQGRFRGNLSGKRVDFSGRTVISPDPNVRIDQVCVPLHQAKILTFPERVTKYNIEDMRRLVLRGPEWPGANRLVRSGGKDVFVLRASKRREVLAKQLQVGDIVERHCWDGDLVLFNRQPSLHRLSIMALHAKVMPWRTLRFNECVCNPFNADFDGDEMNIHLPQTQEARAEAKELMSTLSNLRTPKSGEVMICANQDFLTSAYLVTCKDQFFTRAQFAQLCGFMGDAEDHVTYPVPAIVKPVELWTGKQVISVLMRPNTACPIFVNLDLKEKTYTSREHMCAKDGYVCIINSELVSGRIGKGLLGGAKSGLFGTLAARYSAHVAGHCMSRLAKLSARFIGEQGFSIGITDVTPAPTLLEEKAATIKKSYGICTDFINQYKSGSLELLAGCDEDQSLEHRVQGELNGVRDVAGRFCMRTLQHHNSPFIMASCGSKGSSINIAQMVALVGQQSVSGKRCQDGFVGRTTPHFPRGDKSPAGKGFVANSFYSGLTATEFFFHTMAGREGLVDTAVKTADTGYMSRRLMKSLEDLYLCYDGTVRNSSSSIVQLVYGSDSLDPLVMEGKNGQPLDLSVLFREVKMRSLEPGETLEARSDKVLLPKQLATEVKKQVDRPDLGEKQRCSDTFKDNLVDALQKFTDGFSATRSACGLPPDEKGDPFLEYICGLQALSPQQICEFLDIALDRYEQKMAEPSTPIGAIAAQSLGEPGTQMTLKTFHFAGVASMNVTLGVPRIKEIINAAKTISTPLMEVALEVDNNEFSARMVKGRLEKTTLKDVARCIKLSITDAGPAVVVTLDTDRLYVLNLRIDSAVVRRALVLDRKVKVKEEQVRLLRHDKLSITAADTTPEKLASSLQGILHSIPSVVVGGIATVGRAVIQSEEKEGRKVYKLAVEGTDFRAVMNERGVHGRETITNNICEIEAILGIEAARTKIMKEIKYIFDQYGMGIDHRHIMMLADLMTCKGVVLGITRFGIVDMKESILHSASFERTTDQLFDAAAKGMSDHVTGVSESIILGNQMQIGTGLVDIKQQHEADLTSHRPVPLMAR